MSGTLKDGKANLSFNGNRGRWPIFRKELRSSCDQNGMGWAINIGTAMVQFMIKIAAANASADVKTDIPSNFEDFDAKHFETFDELIQTSGALSTVRLAMIKYRSTISTHFADFHKMGLETQEELDELVAVTNNDYLVQVNRWLVRTIYGAIFPDGHIPTTDTNKLLHIVEGPMTQKILNGEATGFENLWTVEELWRLPGITMFAKLDYKFEGFVDVLNGTFIEEIADLLESATAPGGKGKSIFEVDHAIEELAENIQKNFTDVPTFMKSLRASARQAMIRRLAKYSKDKAAWIKTEDFIQDLLQKNTALTLENTQQAIDRAQTFLSREDRVDKIQTPKALVASTTVSPDIMQQLAVLQAKVAAFEAGQNGFSVCGGGRGGGMRDGHGRGRGTPQVSVGGFLKKCTKCGGNHDDSACFKVGDDLVTKTTEMKKQAEEIEQ